MRRVLAAAGLVCLAAAVLVPLALIHVHVQNAVPGVGHHPRLIVLLACLMALVAVFFVVGLVVWAWVRAVDWCWGQLR